MLDLVSATALLRVLSDPTRVRLLALLRREELTVAELSSVLRLAQPRVSTHLAKLKETGLVRDRRAGVSAYYRFNESGFDGAVSRSRLPCPAASWIAVSITLGGGDEVLDRLCGEVVGHLLGRVFAEIGGWREDGAGEAAVAGDLGAADHVDGDAG